MSTITSKRTSITMRQRSVYHVLKHCGPLTDADLVRVHNVLSPFLDRGARYPEQSPSGLRSRRAELVRKGYVKDTGEKAIAPSGRKATIWEAV